MTAFGLTGIPAAVNTAAELPKPWPSTPSFFGWHADLARSQAHARDDVERRAEVESQIEYRRRQAGLGMGRRSNDAPGRKMLQCPVVAVGARDPIVTECHTGQIDPRLRGENDAGKAGKSQVTA